MDVEFADSGLEQIDKDHSCHGIYSADLAKAFRKVMRFIRAAADERDFRAMRSLNFEKLKGADGQHSMRLNKQWRLIVEIKEGTPKNTVRIVAITDYH